MKFIFIFLGLLISTSSFCQVIGGKLRSPVSKTSDMYVVNTTSDFLYALESNKNKIFLNANINISDYKNILIPANTSIFSYGKSITHSKWIPGILKDTCFVFLTNGENIRIMGVRFIGISGESRNYDKSKGWQGCIKVSHPNFYMTNCSVENFPTWGIQLACSENAVIQESRFIGSSDSGYGYGIWIGGCGNNSFTHRITYCEFSKCRHGIGSSGHPLTWILDHCSFYGIFFNYPLDRHNLYTFCYGGDSTVVTNNYFLVPTTAFGLEKPETDSGMVVVKNNYFSIDSLRSGDICDHRWYVDDDTAKIQIKNNLWDNNFITPKPEIIENALTLSTTQPFYRYEWLCDNKYTYSTTVKKPLTSSVTQLRTWDYNGVPSLPIRKINILQTDTNKLIFSYKDNYAGLSKKFLISVMTNQKVLWKQDLYSNSTLWNRVSLPLTLIPIGDTIRIRVAVTDTLLTGQGTIISIDNVFLKGILMEMEQSTLPMRIKYGIVQNSVSQISVQYGFPLTGNYGLMITFSEGKKYLPKQYVELWAIVN